MIVETIGISGVGKTFLYLSCRERIPAGYKIVGRDYKEPVRPVHPVYLHIIAESIDIEARHILRNRNKIKTSEQVQKELFGIDYRIKFLKRDIWQVRQKYNIWNEEGLYHLFWTHIRRISEYYNIDNTPIVKNRAFIYVHADPETIAENIYKRKKQRNHIKLNHIYKTKKGLITYLQNALNNMQPLLEHIEKYNLPLLSIDSTDEPDANRDRVLTYLKKF